MSLIRDKDFKNPTRKNQRERLYAILSKQLKDFSHMVPYDKYYVIGILRSKIKENKL